MKKLLLLLSLFICILFPFNAISDSTPPHEYTTSAYSKVLNDELYPNVQKYIEHLDIKEPLTQKQSQTISQNIHKIISEYFKDGRLQSPISPTVAVFRLQNAKVAVYIAELRLTLYDEETSIRGKVVLSALYGKRFVIYVHEKIKTELEV